MKTYAKLTAVLLLFLLMMQSVVSVFVYNSWLGAVRKKAKWETLYNLDYSQLTLVKVPHHLQAAPNPYFKWKHSREFSYNGQMYDIVSKQESKDTTYYYCYKDDDETRILAMMKAHLINVVEGKSEEQTGGTAMLFLTKAQYTMPVSNVLFFCIKSIRPIKTNTVIPEPVFLENLVPPPQVG